MAPILGYWKIRGLAQHIRLLLEYTGQEYEEKLYEPGPPPDYDTSMWLKEKFNLGLDLPNLPYYIDGDLKLTQSLAITYHIARQHNLVGQTAREKALVDMWTQQVVDVRRHYAQLVYVTYDTEKEKYLKELPELLKPFSTFLGSKSWFMGEKPTMLDFLIYELLDVILLLDPTCLRAFDNLDKFLQRFRELPAIKKYMASPRFINAPVNWVTAKFNVLE